MPRVTNRWLDRAKSAQTRLRERRTPLTDDLALVEDPNAAPARVTELDETTWLVERGERRRVVPLGAPDLGTTLLTTGRKVRRLKPSHLYEKALLDHACQGHLVWLLTRLKIDVVLDVGANRGQYARGLRAAGYEGRIISFEPVPATLDRLREVSRDDPLWDVVPYALGREDGEAEIHVNDTLSSMLDASEFGVEWKESMGRAPTTTIQVRRLDGVLAEVLDGVTGADGAAPRLYLKLDTQGFDLEAFAGLGDRVSDVLGMQSEVACLPIYEGMPGMSEALETYTAAGFSLTAMFPVSRHVPTMRVIEFDAFLVRDPDPEHPDRHP
ncbi:hypothetical protein GCM10023340_44790 [Nocardioides marinquilinus]|uniref:Methyltransferase FkbM domain-containing protein n=1 Tax=Nocardioides marinquilinus TaxID=1210400 RepID=A0ABP9Q4N8_9ACTN